MDILMLISRLTSVVIASILGCYWLIKKDYKGAMIAGAFVNTELLLWGDY